MYSSCFRFLAGESRPLTRSSLLSPVTIAAQFASLLVDGVPFTRAYPPGHARLKTRWHLYLLGMWAIAYLPVRLELRVLNDALGIGMLLAEGFAVIVDARDRRAPPRAADGRCLPSPRSTTPIPRR
jgi:hypothetical protein